MRIKQLQLTHFRGFEGEVTLDFEQDLTVLVGVNGSGKSSVIDALKFSLRWYIAKLFHVDNQVEGFRYSDISLTAEKGGVTAILDKEATEEAEKLEFLIRGEDTEIHLASLIFWDKIAQKYLAFLRKNPRDHNLQVIISFSAGRRLAGTENSPQENKDFIIPQAQAYEGSLGNNFRFDFFLNWFIDQTNLENQLKIERKDFEAVNPKLQVVRNALTHFLQSFPYANFSNLRTGESPFSALRTKKQTFLIDKNGKTLELNQLSDGEKGALLMVFNIAYRLAIANPASENPLHGTGVVLIDEIDLHLHPSWQKAMIHCLRSTFPNIQFIVTTHSPLIISQVKPRQIRILHDGLISHMDEFVGPFNSYGAELEEILDLVQGLDQILPDDLAEKFQQFFKLIEADKIKEASALKRELEQLTDPSHPEILKGQSIMDLKKLGIR